MAGFLLVRLKKKNLCCDMKLQPKGVMHMLGLKTTAGELVQVV